MIGCVDDINEKKYMYKEIREYYEFHKSIESYFINGFNEKSKGSTETFYFIDSKWLENWKKYTNYENTINFIKKGYDINKIISNKIIKIISDQPSNVESGESEENFLNKEIYAIEDFDCVVKESTYNSFKMIMLNVTVFYVHLKKHFDYSIMIQLTTVM